MSFTVPSSSGVRCGPVPGRRGVTLMEVLISVFVLAVGLLGVAAMIPLGGLTILETNKADRAGACGRASMRDVRIRGMLDPQNWVTYNGGAVWACAMGNYTSTDPNSGPYSPVCIDPLYLASPQVDFSQSDARIFPYGGNTTLSLPRLTLGDTAHVDDTAAAMTFGMAERIFRWAEDLTYYQPDDNDRPLMEFFARNGTVVTASNLTTIAIPATDGNYSWMFTLSPAPSERGNGFSGKMLYTVSVVVFYKRSLSRPVVGIPSERLVKAQCLSGGYGGGDFVLTTTQPDSDYLKVKRGDWLMLVGKQTILNGTSTTTIQVAKWYRIVATSDNPVYDSGAWGRHVVLAGPDWDTTSISGSGSSEYDAILADNVVGVYTMTTKLGRSPLWTRDD